MKLYNVFIKKNSINKIEDLLFIKEGFSYYALVFSGLWFAYHKMWREFFTVILINISFSFLNMFISESDIMLLELFFVIIIAVNANYWLCKHLMQENMEYAGLAFGEDEKDVRKRFFKNWDQKTFEFDDSILNPKLHNQIMKLRKSEPYFSL